MSFTPLSFQILSDTKSVYTHQFIHFECNENLLTGIISALRMLYSEVFKDNLRRIELEDYRVMIQPIGTLDIFLVYNGEEEEATIFVTELLDQLCQSSLLEELFEICKTSTITLSQSERISDLVTKTLPSYTSTLTA